MIHKVKTSVFATTIAVLGMSAGAVLADDVDSGSFVEKQLKHRSEKLFGVEMPLEASAPATAGAYRIPAQSAWDQVLVANGLKVEYLTRNAADHTDMMAFYPEANPTHLITCVEGGRETLATGNEGAKNYAEVVCGVDSNPLVASASQRTVEVNRFVEGDKDFNSFDNLAFQPHTGNLYVIEDHDNGDIFACLPDGADHDIKTDGCVKILSVKDTSAEPTGFLLDATGRTAYVSIQHSDDSLMPLVGGYPTDDIIKITGFKVPHKHHHGQWLKW
jgi:secreted PhoX family phosphatase